MFESTYKNIRQVVSFIWLHISWIIHNSRITN